MHKTDEQQIQSRVSDVPPQLELFKSLKGTVVAVSVKEVPDGKR